MPMSSAAAFSVIKSGFFITLTAVVRWRDIAAGQGMTDYKKRASFF